MENKCDHTSVGILVWDNNKLLLIERGKFPFGFAPPAGHLDGDNFEESAKRELKEEVGLGAKTLKLLLEEKNNNICRREGGTWHHWQVYEATVSGEIKRSLSETKKAVWISKDEIKNLATKTGDYLAGKVDKIAWEKSPGLETVWYDFFRKLEII